MDRRDGTFLTGKLLTPHFAPAALSSVRNNHFCATFLSISLHMISSSNSLNYSESISLLAPTGALINSVDGLLHIQLLESPIPTPTTMSQKASSGDISGTKRGSIDPLVSTTGKQF